MTIFEPPRIGHAEFADLVKAELPGLEFRLEHDASTYMVVMELRRRVEGERVALSDLAVASDDESLARVTREAIDRVRERAMVDYGLRAILDREKVEAHRAGFRAMVENMKTYVSQNMQDWEDLLDDDGNTKEVQVTSWEGNRILAWLKTLSPDDDKH